MCLCLRLGWRWISTGLDSLSALKREDIVFAPIPEMGRDIVCSGWWNERVSQGVRTRRPVEWKGYGSKKIRDKYDSGVKTYIPT